MTGRPLDTDKLAMVPRLKAIDAAHLALDGMQRDDMSPEIIVVGVALAFQQTMDRLGLDPYTMLQMARRVARPEEGHKRANDSLLSLRDWLAIHVKGERGVSTF